VAEIKCHRRLVHREIGIPVDKRSGKSRSEPRHNLSRPITRDRCQGFGKSRRIGKSEFPGLKETGHRKSRNPGVFGTVHLRGRVATISALEKSPIGRPSIGISGIGISEIMGTKVLCILEFRNVKPRSVGASCQHSSEEEEHSASQLSA
jgi:hypothetical protein